MAAINWDEIELLPRFDCCVCAAHSVPWGRTADDSYFCSKRCCEAYEAGRRTVSLARGKARHAPGTGVQSAVASSLT